MPGWPGFTHLRTVSGFSLRYGASHPERLAERAAEREMDAVALTDRDTLAGAVRFAKACAREGVRPVFGVDLALGERPPGAPERRTAGTGTGAGTGPGDGTRLGARRGTGGEGPAGSGGEGSRGAGGAGSRASAGSRGTGGPGLAPATERRRTPVRGGAFIDESAPRAVFLARSRRGWAALCRLVTAAHAAGDGTPLLPWVDNHGDELTVLLGPDSEVGRALAAGRPDRAARLLAPWREVYGDALRLEVVHHGRTGAGPGSLRHAARTLGLAAEQGVRPVLSNAVRYADPGQGPVADVLDAARRLVPVDPRKTLDTGERWLKDPAAMAATAERVAEAAGMGPAAARRLLALTEETAAGCLVDPEDDLGIGSVHFPEPWLVGAGRRTADRVLRSRCAAGMVLRRHDRKRKYWDRLEDELRTIERLGFASYFLTVAQVVDDTRDLGIRVAARGSGAGSLVNHLLGIAHADPVEQDLLMERFLSVRRPALPDIDIDVESARRLEVYRAILDRFGPERVAAVAMPETYRVRHAVRDVGAALSMDPAEIDRVAKAFPHIRAKDARTALDELPELRALSADREKYGRLWELVEALDALPRGVAMHPCGVLLSDASLRSRTPVVPTSGESFPMAQFDKEDVEDLGLLKLDVLGVRMQSAMAYAVGEIERATGERVDLDDPGHVRPGDPATYRLIRSAETLGCFQIESPGQRDLVGRLQPATFHDLVVDISLFRPGPVAADMVRPFIEARHGRAPVRYPHPRLADALAETYGVVVFHEQIIKIIDVLTGCGREEGDAVRRGLSHPESQGRIKVWFARRAEERGYDPGTIDRTWKIVEAFGSYGFCKAHAVSFAVPTYQSAWLKAHHPAAFYAGLLTHDPGMYPKRLLLADARRRGVPVLPLDVNRSSVTHRIELVSGSAAPGSSSGSSSGSAPGSSSGSAPGSGESVWGLRLALSDVHGISEAEAARAEAGRPYVSLLDFWQRARPSHPVAERLARVGALDAFGANRRDLLLHLAELHRSGRGPGAGGDQLPLAGGREAAPVGLPDLNDTERLSAELGVLSMDVSRNLMDDHHAFLDELGVLTARRLNTARDGQTVLVAGSKVATQTPPVRSGRRVVFTTLDDGTGLVDLAFFEDSHEACAHTVFHSWLLLVRGTLQRRGPRSFSVVGAVAWNLAELIDLRREGGLDAVAARLAAPAVPTPSVSPGSPGRPVSGGSSASPGSPTSPGSPASGGSSAPPPPSGTPDGRPAPTGSAAADPLTVAAPGRRITLPTGYQLNPWADLRPPGEGPAGPRKLWHQSPGSAG
ncbi:DNA polymerase III subunit alpha [Streptomyces sp. LP05-1]|uniref:DNA polymerase III subunit alpha n=1 Tax=Streptomyces pyxinae TaxID=2970734 RepID=A0ABT2CLP7_9ACTN|nr:DNA polymerase III subunit alpha [Streptomyces sp. LP05-1]MCS0638332.1 DNA polymerase III subunit alpha [Streptomyces sp. LP05-1]